VWLCFYRYRLFLREQKYVRPTAPPPMELLPDIVVVNLFNFRTDDGRQGLPSRESQELFTISLHHPPEVLVRQGMKAFGSYF
jgi:hypothetical protein